MFNLSLGICIILLLFLVPGALFRKAFNSAKLSDYHKKASTFSELVITIALSVFVQFLVLILLNAIDAFVPNMYQVDVGVIFDIILAKDSKPFELVSNHFMLIVLYQMMIYAGCIFFGRFLLRLIISRGWDKKYSILRFDNEWEYIFTGRIILPNQEFLIKYVNVLVDIDECYIIYSGILLDYTMDSSGKVELLKLQKVKKKIISHTKIFGDTSEYPMSVESFFIPYENVLNFSLTYIQLTPIDNGIETPVKKLQNWFKKYFSSIMLISIIIQLLMIIIVILSIVNKS
jgi:hypothetical protein